MHINSAVHIIFCMLSYDDITKQVVLYVQKIASTMLNPVDPVDPACLLAKTGYNIVRLSQGLARASCDNKLA